MRVPIQAISPEWRDLLLLFVAVSWGLTFLFTKMGLASFDTATFAFLRTAGAAIVLNGFALVHARRHGSARLRPREHLAAIGLGLLGLTGFPYCFSQAMEATSSTNGGLIFGATPVVVGVISVTAGLERLRPANWLGLALSVAGIVAILFPELSARGTASLSGDLLMVAAMLLWAAYTVLNRLLPRRISVLHMTAYASLWGVSGLALLNLRSLMEQDWSGAAGISWLGAACAGVLGTGLAYIVWNLQVQRIGPARTAVSMNLVPVVSALAGFTLLEEPLGGRHLLAALLVIPGVALTQMAPQERSPSRERRAPAPENRPTAPS